MASKDGMSEHHTRGPREQREKQTEVYLAENKGTRLKVCLDDQTAKRVRMTARQSLRAPGSKAEAGTRSK